MAALESVRSAIGLDDIATPEGIDLSLVLFPSPGATPQAKAGVLARFGAESADYAAAVARLRQLGVSGVVASLGRIQADPQVERFDQAVAASLLGKPLTQVGAQPDVAGLAVDFRGYLARNKLLDGLLPAAIKAVSDDARRLAGSQNADFLAWAAATATLILVSIGVALSLARSISKPIKDLAGYAHAINEGQLDAQPPASRRRGPRETRVAFGVFADLVANLRLLDAKANALWPSATSTTPS